MKSKIPYVIYLYGTSRLTISWRFSVYSKLEHQCLLFYRCYCFYTCGAHSLQYFPGNKRNHCWLDFTIASISETHSAVSFPVHDICQPRNIHTQTHHNIATKEIRDFSSPPPITEMCTKTGHIIYLWNMGAMGVNRMWCLCVCVCLSVKNWGFSLSREPDESSLSGWICVSVRSCRGHPCGLDNVGLEKQIVVFS